MGSLYRKAKYYKNNILKIYIYCSKLLMSNLNLQFNNLIKK